jgi:peptidoglycan/LPS O-acetylase OafA/YrhL
MVDRHGLIEESWMPPADRMARNLGLDLVRALAITLVLITHCGGVMTWWLGLPFPMFLNVGGFYGVELFFALSGFLIGGLLLELIERNPGFDGWWRFMLRRWLRTLPLYALCLIGLAVLWRPEGDFGPYLIEYGTLTQNLLWPMPTSNWFGVSWSLTVEEWFYLLFSALLLGGVALTKQRNACLWGVVALFIIVPTLLRWQVPDTVDGGEGLRKVALLRLDAIAYGVLVAKLLRERSTLLGRPLLLMGVALGAVLWFSPPMGPYVSRLPLPAIPTHVSRTFYFTLVPLALALCLPAAIRLQRLPGPLAWLVRRISVQSYALYLVHLDLMLAISAARSKFGLSGAASIVISILAIVGLSYALHRWVEAPIMRRRPAQYPATRNLPVPAVPEPMR